MQRVANILRVEGFLTHQMEFKTCWKVILTVKKVQALEHIINHNKAPLSTQDLDQNDYNSSVQQ